MNTLRPLAIQAEVGYAGRIQGPANSDVFANLEVEYSFSYLDRFVEPIGPIGHGSIWSPTRNWTTRSP